MDFETIVYDEPVVGVARITLNRPRALNSFDGAMIRETYAASQMAADDRSIAVVVYRGLGRAFSAGRDFDYVAKCRQDPKLREELERLWQSWGHQTWLHPKATIAQVHGFAIGSGTSLSVSCDITIASDDCRFGYPELRRGGLMGGRLPWDRLMNPKRVKEYVFTGRMMTSQEACSYGLVNHVIAAADLEAFTLDMAKDIATMERKNPGYISANKAFVNDQHADVSWAQTGAAYRGFMVQDSYVADAAHGMEEFFALAASEGVRVAMDRMHDGFTSRK